MFYLRIYIQLRGSSGQITMFTTMFTNDMNSGENRQRLFKDEAACLSGSTVRMSVDLWTGHKQRPQLRGKIFLYHVFFSRGTMATF